MDMSLSELREMVMDREAWCAVIHGVTKSRTWLSDWTELARVQLQLPGIQPEEMKDVGHEAASQFSFGLPLYFKFKILLYFYKNIRSEAWHFQFPLTQIYYLHKSLLLFRVPASVILWESALSSIIYLL